MDSWIIVTIIWLLDNSYATGNESTENVVSIVCWNLFYLQFVDSGNIIVTFVFNLKRLNVVHKFSNTRNLKVWFFCYGLCRSRLLINIGYLCLDFPCCGEQQPDAAPAQARVVTNASRYRAANLKRSEKNVSEYILIMRRCSSKSDVAQINHN